MRPSACGSASAMRGAPVPDGSGIESEVGVACLGVGEERVEKLGGPVDALDRGVDAPPFERGVRLVRGELQVALGPGERGPYVVGERGQVALEVPLGPHAVYMRTHGAVKPPVDWCCADDLRRFREA